MLISALILGTTANIALAMDKEIERQKLLNKAFLSATFNASTNKMKQLLKAGVDINTKDPFGNTALHDAAFFNDLEKIKLLIENGADINAKNQYGCTALHKTSDPQMASELINNGIDLNAQTDWGSTAAHEAAEKCNCEILQLLYENHADLTKTESNGLTPANLTRKIHSQLQSELNENQQRYTILECNEKDELCSDLQRDILRLQKQVSRCQASETIFEAIQNQK